MYGRRLRAAARVLAVAATSLVVALTCLVLPACGASAASSIDCTPMGDPACRQLTPTVACQFTCDALVDADGTLAGWVARWRQETRGGISVRGLTFDDPEVGNVVEQVLAAVGSVGPANVQGFVHEDGAVTVHEVNPRFSGGLPLSLHAGADLVEEYLRGVLGLRMRPERLVARPGVTMMRHYSEVFAG